MTAATLAQSGALRVLDDGAAGADASGARVAVILMNVGTPDEPSTPAVRRYLREFLSDPRVIDLPALQRWLLLRLIILPFRSPKSAAQYRSVWTSEGSPLLVNSLALADKVRARLPGVAVHVGMRYGNPSLQKAIESAHREGATRVVLVPMFPQYASASTGTALAAAYALLGALPRVPDVSVVAPFFDDEDFVDSVTSIVAEVLHSRVAPAGSAGPVDHVLFSYHGLPLHQVQRIHGTCRGTDACCAALTADNASCYRAQCLATTRAIVARAGVAHHSTSFQSRLGRAVWLLPNTENALDELAQSGVKRLAVVCPSFVADCLETVEEIGVRARERFTAAEGPNRGERELVFIPCVNASDRFADAVTTWVKRALGESP